MYLLLKKFYFHILTFIKTIYKNTDKFVAPLCPTPCSHRNIV